MVGLEGFDEVARYGRPMGMADKPQAPPRAPTGPTPACANWDIEGAYRLLQNNLDPRVALAWERLVVYGGSGRAARTWTDYRRILAALERLRPDETLCVQSGRPVYVGRTHEMAPRVLIANSNLVPNWATPGHFDELDRAGLMMYGQMTAGSWIYIGTQGILQGTFQTFVALAQREYGTDDLTNRWILTGGMGAMSGAQPLAGAMTGACMVVVEALPERIQRKVDEGYCDRMTASLDEALKWKDEAVAKGEGLSIGLVGNAATVAADLLARDEIPDIVTDQTSAHDLLSYWPEGDTADLARLRQEEPGEFRRQAAATAAKHVEAILGLQARGAIAFDYGNALRDQAERAGLAGVRAADGSFAYPGFMPAYIRPLFCQGMGPFRWAALSGEEADIHRTDEEMLRLFPDDAFLHRWLRLARERVPVEGLPTRICWLGHGDRAKAGLAINELVASGALAAPVAIGRDHLDCGSVASPSRETEAMPDGSDAVADWPLLNFGLATASGASWASFHSGGGVGVGLSMHAGLVVVADGAPGKAERLERVLTNDPGIGVARHADAGCEEAVQAAQRLGVDRG